MENETEQEAEEVSENKETPDKGSGEFVEFPDEATEKRFKRIYWNMKQYEQTTKELAAQNKTLIEKLDSMEQRERKKEVGDQTASLREAEKQALENGDFERASTIRDQMVDLKLAAKEPEKAPPPVQEQWLTSDKERQISEWASEMDESGNPLRPWCDEGHEDFETARDLTILYAEKNPEAALADILGAVDKRMGRISKPKRTQAPVLGGNGGVRPKTPKKTSLSEQEKFTARQMYPGDPKALERYAAAKEKYL